METSQQQHRNRIPVRPASDAERIYWQQQRNTIPYREVQIPGARENDVDRPPTAGVKFRVLAIDGGGIRGIIPASVLQQVETVIRKVTGDNDAKLVDYFDMICGTSTGGILSMLYLLPDVSPNSGQGLGGGPSLSTDTPRFSATEALEFYRQNGYSIFSRSLPSAVMKFHGWAFNLYSNNKLASILHTTAGDAYLSRLTKPCLITAYDIEHACPIFMKSHAARLDTHNDFKLVDVALGTSAAPTYFPPHDFSDRAGQSKICAVEGGVIANNPAMCGMVEALRMGIDLIGRQFDINEIALLSLGTGFVKQSIPSGTAKNWVQLKWVMPLMNMLFDGPSNTVNQQLLSLFASADARGQYLRIQPQLQEQIGQLDDASRENIARLTAAGANAVNDGNNHILIEKFVKECLLPMGPRKWLTPEDYICEKLQYETPEDVQCLRSFTPNTHSYTSSPVGRPDVTATPETAGVKFRVLAIDGGGMRDIIPAIILKQIEQMIRKDTENPNARVVDYFDMICGTSTGGILSMLYLLPTKGPRSAEGRTLINENPALGTEDALRFYVKNGANIFSPSGDDALRAESCKYSNQNLKGAIQDIAGDLFLSSLTKPCIITTYDIEQSAPVILSSDIAAYDPSKDYKIVDVALATSSTPSYFPPHKLTAKDGGSKISAIDGGVSGKNPAMCGMVEAMNMGNTLVDRQFDVNEIAMLSLGVGSVKASTTKSQASKSSESELVGWARSMVDVLLDSSSQAVHRQVKNMFKAARANDQYLRVQPTLPVENRQIDNTSTANVEALQKLGTEAAQQPKTRKFVTDCLLPMGPRVRLTPEDYQRV